LLEPLRSLLFKQPCLLPHLEQSLSLMNMETLCLVR